MPRPLRAVAITAALAGLLGGCALLPFPPGGPSTTSEPTGEQVDAALRPYYTQVLQWTGCAEGMQCATAVAPLDWSDPTAGDIELALIRHPATGNRLGSLLINPGGPGGSGVDFVRDSVDYATSARLQQRYDIVGFDPRGVGRSSAVSCYDDPAEMDEFNYGILPGVPGSDEWFAAGDAAFAEWGQACLEHTGELLGFVDTVSAARDLDMLRAALGDERLNLLGYSYGTFLGATYADLFPGRTGRLVLDGAVDPSTSDHDVTRTQAVGFENAFRAYLDDCLVRDGCPFTGTVDQAEASAAALLADLQASPLPHDDGRMLGQSAMFYAIILPLYNQANWPYLDQLFTEVFAGETDTAFFLADAYNERNPDGTYATNSTEAFVAINCLDYRSDTTIAEARVQAVELAHLAPVFGPPMSFGTGCTGWPFPGQRDRVPIAAPGSSEILVIGTTNDPATPYVWAQALAEQLENGHLVTYHGEGHTAYNKSNACVDETVDDYLIDGTVPASDPMC